MLSGRGSKLGAQGISERVEEARQGPAPPSGPLRRETANQLSTYQGPSVLGAPLLPCRPSVLFVTPAPPTQQDGWTCRAHSMQVKTPCTMCDARIPAEPRGQLPRV